MKISVRTVSNVLQDLKKVTETFKGLADRYNLSPSAVTYIFDSHVSIFRRVLPEYLCIDECYAFSGSHGNYVCVLFDFLSTNTIDLLPSRKKEDLIRYFERIPLEERKRVKMVCIDMWETYRIVSKRMFPECKIAVDKFHILQDLQRKIKRIRTRVMNQKIPVGSLKKLQDEASLSKEHRAKLVEYLEKSKKYYLLKNFDWLLFLNEDSRLELLDFNREKQWNTKF